MEAVCDAAVRMRNPYPIDCDTTLERQSVTRASSFSSVLVERQGMLVRRKCVDRMCDYVKFRCFPLREESESRPRKPLRFALQFELAEQVDTSARCACQCFLRVVGFG